MVNAHDTAYRRTDYRVRLPRGGHASLRVDAPLPPELSAVIGEACWAIITGWNPGSVRQSPEVNRAAKRRLLGLLKAASPSVLWPSVGVGSEHWREASLFVVGIDAWRILAIAEACGQHAIVCGKGKAKPALAWL